MSHLLFECKIGKAMLDGKSPSIVKGAMYNSSLALLIGCMDGLIRLLLVDRWSVVSKLDLVNGV